MKKGGLLSFSASIEKTVSAVLVSLEFVFVEARIIN